MGIDIEMTTTETKGKWKRTVKERIETELIKETGKKERDEETERRIWEERLYEKDGD